MPWSNQSGGGGGPWGGPPKNNGPWGSGPQGGGPSGGGNRPPDLEDLFRRSQDKLKDLFPGTGGGRIGGKGVVLLVLIAVAIWLLTGFYTVRPNELGLNLVFGRYVGTTLPGLNYNWPAPIGSVIKPAVTEVKTMEIGVRSAADQRRGPRSSTVDEALMLTGDENIVDIDFAVQWQISPTTPQDYVFNLRDPVATVKAVAESVMREVIGKRTIQPILTTDRQLIESEVRQHMQEALDGYKSGIVIRLVQLLKADPPSEVIDAFRDVQAARQDQDRLKNEAETYASNVVPVARGDAQTVVQQAEAYRSQMVAEAKGAASRFDQVYAEYKNAPQVTRERMFLETMERVFGRMDKIIIDQKNGGVVPYLPLNELNRTPAQAPRPGLPGSNAGRLQGASQQ
ncbi:FtsH protease activity modulator HflK [Terrarubrum flagellatum]|uniref:FtsH protease activity modulator HflK n=1 Tax=Terrirubrum flagellatum TaxID=2895980 RepID=UPI0031450F59